MADSNLPPGDDTPEEAGPTLSAEEQRTLRAAVEQAGGGSLASRITRRYLGMGRDLLSDKNPEKLDSGTRDRLSRLLGVDPGDVNIHVGELAQEASDSLGARAFTLGTRDVFFGRGQYNPASPSGQALLAHELTHVYEESGKVALSVHDDIGRHSVRDGEEMAHSAERQMFRQAVNDEAESREGQGMDELYELTPGEKILLEEKVHKILLQQDRMHRERMGR
jgi:hypothetical protein